MQGNWNNLSMTAVFSVIVVLAAVVFLLFVLVAIGFAFGGAAMALTTYMRSWQDFDYITLGTLPLFLFSGTFFPISQLPAYIRPLAYATPLWHGVELCRMFTLGDVDWLRVLGHSAYLMLFVVIGFLWAERTYAQRLRK